jgi:hypothetical protein
MKTDLLFKSARRFIEQNSSQILTGIGLIGFAATIPLSIKAYNKCMEDLDARREELGVDELTTGEVVKICWKPMIIPTLMFATSSACVIGAQQKILKKNAALIAAYKTAETSLAEWKNQTKAEIGEEKYKALQEKVVEKEMQEAQVPAKTYLDSNKNLYYDGVYGGYFYATELEVYKAFEETRSDLEWCKNTQVSNYEEYVPLTDLYWRLHHEPIGIGDDWGYPVSKYQHNKFDYSIEREFKEAPNGHKALVICYDEAVKIDRSH